MPARGPEESKRRRLDLHERHGERFSAQGEHMAVRRD
jgi:hypothetical protein